MTAVGIGTSSTLVVVSSSPVRSIASALSHASSWTIDLDALLQPHRANAEDRLHVDEADAANFHVMLLQLVAAADDDVVAAARGDHEIVGDEPMPALHEIQHALGLADAALPHEEKPDAVDVGERAVERGRGRELFRDRGLHAREEFGGLERAAQNRRRRARARPASSRRERSAPS